MARNKFGAVFTRSWVVDLMLDSCGYVPESDLAVRLAVEPSCGEGAFLLPMVSRLCESLRNHSRSVSDAVDAIRAFDVQEQHVQSCREAIVTLLIAEGHPEAAARSISKTWVRQADYLLSDEAAVADFVVGNPPYIRSGDMSPSLRSAYMDCCSTVTAGSDIYVGFIERGLRSLRNGGVLCFICADRWMHNTYGRKLRRLVVDEYSVQLVLEMHEVDAFTESVSAYPAIIQIGTGAQGNVLFATARDTFSEKSAVEFFRWTHQGQPMSYQGCDFTASVLPHWFKGDAVWPSASPERLSLIERLEERFYSLEDPGTGTRIGIGIATGADSVFIVRDDTLVESDRLIPLVTTDHVCSGVLAWNSTWLVNPWDTDGSLVNLDEYPKMRAYLNKHADTLRKRHVATRGSSLAWFRTIDKLNPSLCNRPKLLLQDIKATIQPVYDSGLYYPHHNLYWITSDKWDLQVLGGLLLSKVAEMFVSAYGVKMRGGTLRFQAQYLRQVRVPDPGSIAPEIAKQLAQAFRKRDVAAATAAALVVYGLEGLPN